MLGLFSNHFTSPWVKSESELWKIFEKVGFLKTVNAGTIIYNQSESTVNFFYLKSGRVKVFITSPDGAEKTLAIHEPGSLFGETSAFDRIPRLASAIALVKSDIISVHPDILLQLFARNPQLALSMLQSLTIKIRLLSMQVDSMAFMEADKKVANILLRLAADFGMPTEKGIRLSVKCTHEDLANLVGTCRVTVTKSLAGFVKKGWIENRYRNITILDHDSLTRFAFQEK